MRTFVLLLACCLFSIVTAQNQSPILRSSSSGNNIWIWFDDKNQKNNAPNFLRNYSDELGLKKQDALVYQQTFADNFGGMHHRYQQKYNNIPIENAVVMLHEKGSIVQSANGMIAKDISLNTTPSLTEQQALNQALQYLNATRYAWNSPQHMVWLREREGSQATFLPKGKLIIASTKHSGKAVSYTHLTLPTICSV